MRRIIKQATIIQPGSSLHDQKRDILIENGVFVEIVEEINQSSDNFIEGKNICVSGGWVDGFVDYREPGHEQAETIESGLKTAAAGGFTQVLCLPNTLPSISNAGAVVHLKEKAKNRFTQLQVMGSVSQNIEGKNLSEMMDMHQMGAIAFTDGWSPVQAGNLMLKALEYVKSFDGLIVQMPIDKNYSEGGLMHEGVTSTQLGMPGIPELAEVALIQRDLEILRYTQSRLHISGLSSRKSVQLIREAKSEGLNVTCSVTPYHLTLNDEALKTYDSLYKVFPPLREENDRLALVQALSDGTIDCISSHHHPQDWDAKSREFEYAGEGMAIQQFVFPIVWEKLQKEVSLPRLIDALSVRPREIFGLQKPLFEVGTKAEITVFSTEETTSISAENSFSKSLNNPFLNQTFKGKIFNLDQ